MAAYALQGWSTDLFEGEEGFQFDFGYFPTWYKPASLLDDAWYQEGSYTALLDGVGGCFSGQDQNLTSKLATVWSPPVPTANQFASCEVQVLSLPAGGGSYAGVSVRFSSNAGGGNPACYALVYDSTVPGWKLIKQAAGAQTVLATYSGTGQNVPIGSSGSCALLASGTTLTAVTNGIAHAPVTDAVVAGPGAIGIFLGTHGGGDVLTGIHVRNLLTGYIP